MYLAGIFWDVMMCAIVSMVLPWVLACCVIAVGLLKAVSEHYRDTRQVTFMRGQSATMCVS